MRAFVDRIEGSTCVLLLGEDESVTVNVPNAWLPPGVREGMVLRIDVSIDVTATASAKASVQALLNDLRNEP